MKLKVAGVALVVLAAGTVAALALAGTINITPITVAPKDSAGTVTIVGIDGGDSAGQVINVLSYSVGVDNTGSGVGSGGGTGRATLHEFTITKLIDKASPNLFLACATGRHIARVTLVLNRPNAPAGTPFMTYRLDDVLITSDTHSGSGSDRPTERLTFQYSRIDQTYTTSDGETVETAFSDAG